MDYAHPDSMDSLNSFGDTETIPPYTLGGVSYPLGRIIRGATASYYPDKSMDTMFAAQGVQSPVTVDTEWLLVGHVDETLSFMKASSTLGWILIVADPTRAVEMFQDLETQGYGTSQVFAGMQWFPNGNAATTVNKILNDTDVMNASAWAATEIDSQITRMKQLTGLTDADIVKAPFLWETSQSYCVAYQPGLANGIVLSDHDYGAPEPHGPSIGGVDPFKTELENNLATRGIDVRWIEDWDLYHALEGEVHCGSNTTRAIPATAWWEAAQ